jgi:S1-C subfamily serine protease
MNKSIFVLDVIITTLIIYGCVTNEYTSKVRDNGKEAYENFKKNQLNSYPMIGFIEENNVIFSVQNNAKLYDLKQGDKIIAINGKSVLNGDEVLSEIRKVNIGDKVTLRIIRNNKELEIKAATIDSKLGLDMLADVFLSMSLENWNDCIEKINKLIAIEGPSGNSLRIRTDCYYCQRIWNKSYYVSQEEAYSGYELSRQLISESQYKQGGVEAIRGEILYGIDFLQKNNYVTYAQDLKNMLDKYTQNKDPEPATSSTGQTISTGTGFTISNQGFIATANHVVENAKEINVHFGSTAMEATIFHSDPMNDIAILKVEKLTPKYLSIAPMRSAKTGDRVFTVGYPLSSILGQEIKYTEGVISSLSGLKGAASFFQITVPVQPGNSGGALVNEKGQVVGIISSSAAIMPFLKESGTLPQNINWAVKSDYIRPLLDLPEEPQKPLTREEAIEKAKQATVMIVAISQ